MVARCAKKLRHIDVKEDSRANFYAPIAATGFSSRPRHSGRYPGRKAAVRSWIRMWLSCLCESLSPWGSCSSVMDERFSGQEFMVGIRGSGGDGRHLSV